MKKRLINLSIYLMGSLTACICMLLIVFSLQKQEGVFFEKIQILTRQLIKEKEQLKTLQFTTRTLCQSMQFKGRKDGYPDNVIFLKYAEQHHLKNVELTALPTETVYHDQKMTLRKMPIRMNFMLTKDQNFWKFLNALQESFPASILIQFLSIERIYFKERLGIFLKASFHFDWYTILISADAS